MSSVVSVRTLCRTAVMAALICILTMVPRIPIPLGYAHLGDAAIFLVVLFVGRKEGAMAASIGSVTPWESEKTAIRIKHSLSPRCI